MTNTRFDQKPNELYGRCSDCDIEITTDEQCNEHLHETGAAARAEGKATSHRVTILDPTRESRIRSHVAWAMDDAIRGLCEDLQREVDRGDLTAAEVTQALANYPDFADGWDEYQA